LDSFQLSLFLHSSKGKRSDSVAQLVEQYTFNVWALGSSPSGITKLRRKSGLFCFKDLSKARFRKGTRNKKATRTRSVLVRGFGLAQCGVKSAKRSGADNPIILQEYGNYLELPFVSHLTCLTYYHRSMTEQTS
jgi:hypothetical protein